MKNIYFDYMLIISNQFSKKKFSNNLNFFRIIKMATKKNEQEEKKEKLEDGFSIYVNGAHKKNEKYTPRYTVTKSSDSNKKMVNFSPNVHVVKHSNYNDLRNNKQNLCSNSNTCDKKERKKWGNSSFIIKTMEGYEIKINAPNSNEDPISKPEKIKNENDNENDCYSDDFESDSECENENLSHNDNKLKRNKNLIQSVRFSDTSDSEDENTNKKKFVVDLSSKEIKVSI